MAGLPFDILASTAISEQKPLSGSAEQVSSASLFSQNLDAAVNATFDKKALKKVEFSAEVQKDELVAEKIKLLDQIDSEILVNLGDLLLNLEENLELLSEKLGLESEEFKILIQSLWTQLAIHINPQNVQKQENLTQFIFQIKDVLSFFNDQVQASEPTVTKDQLDKILANLDKKQFFSKTDKNVEQKLTETIQKNDGPVQQDSATKEIKLQTELEGKVKENLVEVKAKDQPNPTIKKDTHEPKQTELKTESVKALEGSFKEEVTKETKAQVKEEKGNIDVARFSFLKSKDQPVQSLTRDDLRLITFKLHFMKSIREKINSLPSYQLKHAQLKNLIDEQMNQLKQFADLKTIAVKNPMLMQQVSKSLVKLIQEFNEAEVIPQIKVENTEEVDEETLLKAEKKESKDSRFTHRSAALVKSRVESGYQTRVVHFDQQIEQSLDILTKHTTQQSKEVEAVLEKTTFQEDVKQDVASSNKTVKAQTVNLEVQQKPTEISKPEMTDAPKYNSDPERIARMMQSVKEHMRLWVDRKYTAMKVQLDPAELGKIQLKTVVEQGKIGVLMQAESVMAKELLSQNIDQMKNLLQTMGLDVASFNVADWEYEDGSSYQQFGKNNSGKFDFEALLGEEKEEEQPVEKLQNVKSGLINSVA